MVDKMESSQKGKKRQKKRASSSVEPAAKMSKKDNSEPEFTHIRFKFLLRSQDTVVTGLQTFVEMCEDTGDEVEDSKGLKLLEDYLTSSPQCSEVMDLLSSKASSHEISLVFAWMRMVLQKCPRVVQAQSSLQLSLVKTLLTRHHHLVMNSLRRGNKTSYVRSTLMLLVTVASLGFKFAKLLQAHLDFTHANWPALLSLRDRKVEIDVRSCMIAILMTLLQVEDDDLTRSIVDQRVLLQEVMLGLKYDRSEYVVHTLNTIHRCVVKNGSVGKTAKMYLFNSPVMKELLCLYQWPGPSQWKRQPTEDEKMEYSEEQQEVARWVHSVLMDLLTNHKLGVCFRDRSLGLSNENKNPAVSKVLQMLVTSYSSPLSHQLVLAVLQACPDQTSAFLKLLQPHLAPRPLDTWITCLRFFLKIVENLEWPSAVMDNSDMTTEDKASQLAHVLFPPDSIISSLKDGLKNACATVRHLCLQALEAIAERGRHFCEISRNRLGHQAPLTLGIEGIINKTVPKGQVLLNLLQKFSSKDSFTVPVTRQLYKDTEVPLPHVSRFQHLVAVVRMYSLVPEHLTGGPTDTLTCLLNLVTEVAVSEDELDLPPDGAPRNLPALCLLHALSQCDPKKLSLCGKGGSKGDLRQSLMFQLVGLMQAQSGSDSDMYTAHCLIVKLLVRTGLFDGQEREVAVWLHHLQSADSAPEEVVTFFVGVLRQYMPNPYPAIDRLLELMEESPQLTEGHYLPHTRLEFSPLVMFALEGDFHTHKKVHQYLCRVLLDILHSVHNPFTLARLVHTLSSNLDPEVTLYLTLHTKDEEVTSQSISKRLCKRLRIKQIKSFKHPGLMLIKTLVKGEREVNSLVGSLSASSCLPLIEQCLRYLDELVFVSVRTGGELLHLKLGQVCMEVVRATCVHLLCWAHDRDDASTVTETSLEDTVADVEMEVEGKGDSSDGRQSDGKTGNRKSGERVKVRRSFSTGSDSSLEQLDSASDDDDNDDDDDDDDDDSDSDEEEEEEDDLGLSQTMEDKEVIVPNRYCATLTSDLPLGVSSVAELSELKTEVSRSVMSCLLKHPLISQWLFVDGFRQGGTPREWIVTELCDIIQTLVCLHESSFSMGSMVDVTARCSQLIQAASLSGSDVSAGIPESEQPLLCRCVDAMLAVGDDKQRGKSLLILLRVPERSFLTQPSQRPSPLTETVFKVAKNTQLDHKTLKELRSDPDFSSSMEGLFNLVSSVHSGQLESLAVKCLQHIPDLSSACSPGAFHGLLNRLKDQGSPRLKDQASPRLKDLVETLMTHSPRCRASCAQWLKTKRKSMKQRKGEFAPIMLMYLRLALNSGDTGSSDQGDQAVCEAVCSDLTVQLQDLEHADPVYLHVLCHLVAHNRIDPERLQKVQDAILLLARREVQLQEEHIQLLAAVLRQQSVHACGVGHDEDQGEGWSQYERTVGRVQLACVKYLISGRQRIGIQDPVQQTCSRRLVQLCQELLFLTIQPDVRAAILTLWPDIVSCFLKYHYKEAQYISLLRQLVQKVFADEDQTGPEESSDEEEEDMETSQKSGNDDGSSGEEEDDDEDDDDEDDEDNTEVVTVKLADKKTKLPSNPKQPALRQQNHRDSRSIVVDFCRRLEVTRASDVALKCVKLFGEELDSDGQAITIRSQIVNRWTGWGAGHKSFFLWPRQDQATSDPRVTLTSLSHGAAMVEVCEKVVGHTAFLSVLQEKELEEVRGEVVGLLASVVRLHPPSSSTLPLRPLMAAYRTSLSLTDQNLLYLMLTCDLHGKERFRPGVWGEQAVKELQVKKQLGRSLVTESNLQNILELLDPDIMATSTLHFPLLRTLQFCQTESAVKAERMMSQDNCYDPRFLLQVFFHFMGPECIVDVRSFLSHGGLGFALAALSSHDLLTRKLAIGVLSNLYSHVESVQRWSAAPILLAFLKVVMNGMTRDCQKLPSIITSFLAKAADFFMKPGSDMYVAVYSFLLLKPALDMNNVPEFYQLFNSPKPKERVWMLRLLQEGLRETSDHRLFQRRFVYKLLTCHANSSFCDQQTKKEILKVLVKASSIATVAKDLVTKHGHLPWLVAFIKDSLPDNSEMTGLVCRLLHNLCYTPEFNHQRLWWLSLPRLSRQCLLHTPLLVCLRLLLENFSHLDIQGVEMLLDILQHPHITPSTAFTLLPLLVTLTWHIGRLKRDAETTAMAASLGQRLQLKTPAGSHATPPSTLHSQQQGDSSEGQQCVCLQKRVLQLLARCDTQQGAVVTAGHHTDSPSSAQVVETLRTCLSQ